MNVRKQWEMEVEKSRTNLWLVVTNTGSFLCKKIKGRFFVKDCAEMLPVKDEVLSSEKL